MSCAEKLEMASTLSKPESDQIFGVIVKALRTFPDDRGFFREITRSSEPIFAGGTFAQWSHSKMQRNVVKAWHYHHLQTDWWYVGLGEVEVVLFDNRPESPTYKTKLHFNMGDSSEVCVRIPPGVLHGLKVISDFAHLFYITSEVYNPDDEGRFAYNDPMVPHAWGDGVITVERDRKPFVPKAVRQLVK